MKLCVVCEKRKAIRIIVDGEYKACQPCSEVTAAENTRAQYGLPLAYKNKTSVPQELRRQAVEFARLTEIGWTLQEIADKWGCTRTAAGQRLNTMRKCGLNIPNAIRSSTKTRRVRTESMKVDGRGRNTNPHGGGKWGIKGCPCDPCAERRKETKRQYHIDKKGKTKPS